MERCRPPVGVYRHELDRGGLEAPGKAGGYESCPVLEAGSPRPLLTPPTSHPEPWDPNWNTLLEAGLSQQVDPPVSFLA